MNLGNVALLTAMYVAVGLAVLVVLWPTEQSGQRFLTRWGIVSPTPEQGRTVASYLLTRRLLYLALFLAAPPLLAAGYSVLGLVGSADDGAYRLLVPLVVALLLAESVAALRQVRGVRVAVLAPRGWRDLVPSWALGLLLGLAVLALTLAGLTLLAQPWADRVAGGLPTNTEGFFVSEDTRAEYVSSPGWLVIGGVAVCLGLVLGLVRLAVRRQAVADPRVDAVLRARTARVAVGVGMGWLGSLVVEANNRLGFLDTMSQWSDPGLGPPGWIGPVHSMTWFLGLVMMLVVAAGWIWVANPPQRARYLRAVG